MQRKAAAARSQRTTWSRLKGDAGIDREYLDPIFQVEEYLELVALDEAEIGMVIGPRFDAEHEKVELVINLRVLNDGEDMYAVDGVFTHESNWPVYCDEVYPQLIERFEDRFPESQIQYYKP